MVGCLFREYLTKHGFVEIHTPKLVLGGVSPQSSRIDEGEAFSMGQYFDRVNNHNKARLATSPQLYKQMAAACMGLERVFTTGPNFRCEYGTTSRHLCEFVGLDLEMVIEEHYDEVLTVLSELLVYILDGLNERCQPELERVRQSQASFQDVQYLRPTLKLTYAEGCALLREAGLGQDNYEDMDIMKQLDLGKIVKERYGTDFFILDKYPLASRPFYTMPCPGNPKLSNSFDFFLRGQEILSGSQRIHDVELLRQRAEACGIDVAASTMSSNFGSYLQSFQHGVFPHGGAGIGLERLVMTFLGLPNIRNASMFPRDSKRLAP